MIGLDIVKNNKRKFINNYDLSLLSNIENVYKYLTNVHKLTPTQATALMGNIMLESSWNPSAKQINGDKALGLFQMHGDLLKAYQKYLLTTGKKDSLYSPLDYVVDMIKESKDSKGNLLAPHPYTAEYNRVYSLVKPYLGKSNLTPRLLNDVNYYYNTYGNRLRSGKLYLINDLLNAWNNPETSVKDLTKIFTNVFERSGNPEYDKRIGYALEYYDYYKPSYKVGGKLAKYLVGGYIDYPTNLFYTKIGNQIRDLIRGDSENSLISYDYYTWNLIPTEQKNLVRGNIARALISRPTPGNLYNALRVWAGWEDPENPNLVKGIPPDVTGYKNPLLLKSFIIPAMNPAEAAAARDFMKTPEYKRFIKTNPGTIIETKARPGISSDWSYPLDVMIRHGLRKNPIKVTDLTSKIPEGKSGNYQKTYNQNLADDKREHIGKRLRRDFLQKIALSSSDGRRANAGRPNERNIRYVFDNIENYPQSVLKGLERVIKSIAKSADKQGITINREDMIKDSRVKRYLKELLEQLKNGLLK